MCVHMGICRGRKSGMNIRVRSHRNSPRTSIPYYCKQGLFCKLVHVAVQLLCPGEVVVWEVVVHVAIDMLELDPDREVPDKFAEDADEIGVCLVLRQLLLRVIPVRNDSIAISSDLSCSLCV